MEVIYIIGITFLLLFMIVIMYSTRAVKPVKKIPALDIEAECDSDDDSAEEFDLYDSIYNFMLKQRKYMSTIE